LDPGGALRRHPPLGSLSRATTTKIIERFAKKGRAHAPSNRSHPETPRYPPHHERIAMLAVAWDSASGKTTLTKGLVQAIGEHRISSFCTDDYHRYDRVERKSLPFTPLNPESNFLEIMEQHLQLLILGQPILKPKYHHANGSLGRPELFTPREIVIVEGLFPLWSRLSRATFNVTAYFDPPEPIRREWKIQRDVARRGYTEVQVLADLDKREPESEKYTRSQ